jgi:hypothetical protein
MKEASNDPKACPPCLGSCNQGRQCPAQREPSFTPPFLVLMGLIAFWGLLIAAAIKWGMPVVAGMVGFALGFVGALLLSWWALGELMGGVKTFWTGK